MRYEDRVVLALEALYGSALQTQVPCNGGYADALLPPRIFLEIKLRYCYDAYEQLRQYSYGIPDSVRVAIVQQNDITVRTPEQPTYVRGLESLEKLGPGYYVIPWTGRYGRI